MAFQTILCRTRTSVTVDPTISGAVKLRYEFRNPGYRRIGIQLSFFLNSPTLNSERILHSELQLAHGDAKCQGVDDTETQVGRIRLARNCRARLNTPIGTSPVRMVQQVERFRTELNLMCFLVWHAEVLVYFG